MMTVYEISDGRFYLKRCQYSDLLLRVMGITSEMLISHLKETNTVPNVVDTKNYLKAWNEIFDAWSKGSNEFETTITTFEGHQFYARIQ